jgi:hypothetical protein
MCVLIYAYELKYVLYVSTLLVNSVQLIQTTVVNNGLQTLIFVSIAHNTQNSILINVPNTDPLLILTTAIPGRI